MTDKANEVLLFSSEVQSSAIKNCHTLVADGTFDLAPRDFVQIWTIHGLVCVTNTFRHNNLIKI
jgi:hypothetical protein